MIADLVVKQLMAVRASAEALIHSIDMFQSMSEQAAAEKNAPPPPPPSLSANPEECEHPKEHRIPTPVMGNLKRQLCGVCGKETTE